MPTLLLCLLVVAQAQADPPKQDPPKQDAPKQDPPKQDAPKQEAKSGATLTVPLVEKASVGGQIRLRVEMKDPVDYRLPGTFGRPASEDVSDGDEYVLLRVRAHLDVLIVQDLRAFVQLQDSRAFGEEGSVLGDLESTDVHQGWVEASNLFGEPLSVKAGRMEVPNLGDMRLVGSLDWHNVARSWDGASVVYAPSGFWVNAFGVLLNENPGSNGRDDYFYGVYASYRGLERHELDAYVFARDFRANVTGEDGASGDLADQTLGVRFKGAMAGFDYTAEAAFQIGEYATDDVSAHAWAVTLGYTFASIPWKPRVGIELARATGDDDPTDGDRGTFDPLFSFGHVYHGYYDVVMWKNARTFMLSVRAQPHERVTLQIDGHVFQLDEERDGWYSVPAGATIRRDPSGAANRDLGWEIDAHAKVKIGEHVDVWAGVTHFEAGEFVEDTGPSPSGTWFFAQMGVKF